ncbi:DUF6745 domain-containing protein [Nocardia sp. NPDC050697]|uniref:DUF6745 domain-containing protein n=1 Tax=Nocardia sp. NPDC050697 TaxID=3155158 RepID=UPI0033CF9595
MSTETWRAIAATAAPADRPAAEAAVRLAYHRAGLPAPTTVIWAGSPSAAVTAVRGLTNPGASVRDRVRTKPWAAERARLAAELGQDGWAAHWADTGGRLWDLTRALTTVVREQIVATQADAILAPKADAKARARIESELRALLLDAVLGQHDAPWLAAFDGAPALAGVAGVARAAGWWWPYEHAVVLSERPVRLLRDEAGRLHCGDGAALAYPDGFALHAWSGMPVPAELVADLSTLTPERIRVEENAELRRVMLEHFGYDRYLTESNAEPVHRDETGILWRIPLPGDEDVVMVEVVNSTAEPDGSFRTYWLRVPPGTATARAGVAWTFGLDEDEYVPERQT